MHDPLRDERGFTIHAPIGDQQTLDTDRFSLTWRPAEAEALGEEGLSEFQGAVMGLTSHLRDEYNSDPEVVARAAGNRRHAVRYLSTVLNIVGTTITYNGDRNARYTNVGGAWMAEPLIATRPSEASLGRVNDIRNPLNYPEWN